MGAKAVLLGRATLYGLAADGERGVEAVLSMLKSEIDTTLAQIGCPDIGQLSRDFLWPLGPNADGGASAPSPLTHLFEAS
jgi:(S)-mandelate dehydrogenase